MYKIIFETTLLIIVLALTACNQDDISAPSGEQNKRKVYLIIDRQQFQKADNERKEGKAESDPFQIDKVERSGDTLKITVTYSGGCKEHTFNIFWNGTVLLSFPPQVYLILTHNADGDPCDALITETLIVDLKEMFGDNDFAQGDYIFNVFNILNSTGNPDIIYYP